MKQFSAPDKIISGLEADAVLALIEAAADVSLVVDRHGMIVDGASSDPALTAAMMKWIGRPWADTVTVESREKVADLFASAFEGSTTVEREINHVDSGRDLPVAYVAAPLKGSDYICAVGRDLRAISALQQRLVEAQQILEEDYAKLRNVETRYRLLFEITSQPVLIADSQTLRIEEANPAAASLFAPSVRHLAGRTLISLAAVEDVETLENLFKTVRTNMRAEEASIALTDGLGVHLVTASLFRHETRSLILMRIAPAVAASPARTEDAPGLMSAIERAPDGFVMTDHRGEIDITNAAFLEFVQLTTPEQVKGESFERWLARGRVDFNVLSTLLRETGSVRLFSTILRGFHGLETPVEISAVAITDGALPRYAFSIRNVGRRLSGEASMSATLPYSLDQLTELVGRVSLKDLVRRTTDVMERLYIEAALKLTGDNRASTAEILGLSRQSLYVKLRRHGIGDLDGHGRRDGADSETDPDDDGGTRTGD